MPFRIWCHKVCESEINPLLKEQDLLLQAFDLVFVLLLSSSPRPSPFVPIDLFCHGKAGFSTVFQYFMCYRKLEGAICGSLPTARDLILPKATAAAGLISALLLYLSWAIKAAAFKSFIQKAESIALVMDRLNAVRPPAAEQKQCIAAWIQLKVVPDDIDQTVQLFSHFCISSADVGFFNTENVT